MIFWIVREPPPGARVSLLGGLRNITGASASHPVRPFAAADVERGRGMLVVDAEGTVRSR
jgi:hypothetical protein